MQNSKLTKGQKIGAFLRKNLYFIILGITLIAVATTLILVTPRDRKPEVEDVDGPIPLAFTAPLSTIEIIKGYSDISLQYNSTLKWWEAHKAIDFKAEQGANVVAAEAGKVVKITTDLLMGTTITIEHAEGLKTIYSNLASNPEVTENKEVKKGDVIGKVSAAIGSEEKDGPHLHFIMTKNDKKINPENYIDLGDK